MVREYSSGLSDIALSYIKLLKIKVSSPSLRRSLEESPYFPTLLSLSDTFHQFHIDNEAYSLAPEDITSVDPPFVAYVQPGKLGNELILITEISQDTVTHMYRNGKTATISVKDFLSMYRNVIWIAYAGNSSGEKNYSSKIREIKRARLLKYLCTAGFLAIILAIVGQSFERTFAASFLSILIIKSVGITCSLMLLLYENNKNNKFIKSICNAGRKLNCAAVLESKANKIFGISWSEIGFFIFSSAQFSFYYPALAFSIKRNG